MGGSRVALYGSALGAISAAVVVNPRTVSGASFLLHESSQASSTSPANNKSCETHTASGST